MQPSFLALCMCSKVCLYHRLLASVGWGSCLWYLLYHHGRSPGNVKISAIAVPSETEVTQQGAIQLSIVQ